jgi:alkylation response protein AidB-like acyl-CoA dehydrogenase
VAFSLAITELARACASTAVSVSVSNMVAEVIQAIGTDDQKQEYLPKLCSGEFYGGSFCLTETEAGSDPAAMKTRAVKDGDSWVLNGTKVWISTAAIAGVYVVWAVTDPSAPKGKGISCFLVPAGTPGLKVGKPEQKMGQKGSGTHEVIFEDCRIPLDALMGAENQGFKIAVTELAGGRIGIASLALGVAGAALDYARDYIKERKQFGRPLADFQGLQWILADHYTEMEAARLLTMQAAAFKEAGKPFANQASMAKLMATEKGNQACYSALQLLGANGYMKDYPLERFARDIRVTSIYEGTSEIQKVIIARNLFAG